jgi:hypothetical protein
MTKIIEKNEPIQIHTSQEEHQEIIQALFTTDEVICMMGVMANYLNALPDSLPDDERFPFLSVMSKLYIGVTEDIRATFDKRLSSIGIEFKYTTTIRDFPECEDNNKPHPGDIH